MGPIIRHGPHQGAQQSSKTTPAELTISCEKVVSVTITGWLAVADDTGGRVARHCPHLATRPGRELGSIRFLLPHFSQVTIGIFVSPPTLNHMLHRKSFAKLLSDGL